MDITSCQIINNKTNTPQGRRKTICKYCSEDLCTKKDLKVHVSSNCDRKHYLLNYSRCVECNQNFPTFESYQSHLNETGHSHRKGVKSESQQESSIQQVHPTHASAAIRRPSSHIPMNMSTQQNLNKGALYLGHASTHQGALAAFTRVLICQGNDNNHSKYAFSSNCHHGSLGFECENLFAGLKEAIRNNIACVDVTVSSLPLHHYVCLLTDSPSLATCDKGLLAEIISHVSRDPYFHRLELETKQLLSQFQRYDLNYVSEFSNHHALNLARDELASCIKKHNDRRLATENYGQIHRQSPITRPLSLSDPRLTSTRSKLTSGSSDTTSEDGRNAGSPSEPSPAHRSITSYSSSDNLTSNSYSSPPTQQYRQVRTASEKASAADIKGAAQMAEACCGLYDNMLSHLHYRLDQPPSEHAPSLAEPMSKASDGRTDSPTTASSASSVYSKDANHGTSSVSRSQSREEPKAEVPYYYPYMANADPTNAVPPGFTAAWYP